MTTLGLLKIKVFWNKVYDIMDSVYDVTNKILSRDPNNIIDAVMWPRFGNSNISVGEVIITSILWGFDQDKHFLRGDLGSSNLWLGSASDFTSV